MSDPLVSVLVLNYKQAKYVPYCINALQQQTYSNIEVFFIDNASCDGAVEYVKSNYPSIIILANDTNLYYSKAHNIAIKKSRGQYVMPLNIDVLVAKDYIEQMVLAMELDASVGMVSGKLLQMNENLESLMPPIIDSTGLWFSPAMRHFDRNSGERDTGQCETVEYIFGPSGAAPLYRRAMLDNVKFEDEYFDDDFVIYREDADLAWRGQLCGWKGLYTHRAIAYHVRRVRATDKRRNISPDINMHSVKNRFLMRIKNQTFHNGFRYIIPTLWRDFLVLSYVILIEHTSMIAIAKVVILFPRMLRKRRKIMSQSCVSHHYIAQWFSPKPVSFPY